MGNYFLSSPPLIFLPLLWIVTEGEEDEKNYESAKGSSPLSAGVGLGWVINRTVKVKRRMHHRSWHVEVFIAAALDWATRPTRWNQFLTEFCQLLVKERVIHSRHLFHSSPERIELRKDFLSFAPSHHFLSFPVRFTSKLARRGTFPTRCSDKDVPSAMRLLVWVLKKTRGRVRWVEEAKRNGYAIDSQSKNNWMENQSFPRESFNSLSRVQSKCSVLQSSPDATNFELPIPRIFLFTWIGSDESVIELPLGHIIVQCLKEYDEQGGKESWQHRIEHNVE